MKQGLASIASQWQRLIQGMGQDARTSRFEGIFDDGRQACSSCSRENVKERFAQNLVSRLLRSARHPAIPRHDAYLAVEQDQANVDRVENRTYHQIRCTTQHGWSLASRCLR